MKLRYYTCICICLFLASCNSSNKEIPKSKNDSDEITPKTIMAIFAHPDDETTIAPVLAKYAFLSDVHLVVATDGRYGETNHAGIPAGDSLVAMRKQETECACAALNINPPHFLGAKDGLGLNSHHDYYEEVKKLKVRIHQKIKELKPNIILTFGPDGDTGHPDHRLVGLLTSEVLLRERWAKDIDLYYFGWTIEQTKKFPEEWGLGYVHPDYLNTAIRFSLEDEEKAFTSLECHKTQFTENEFSSWIDEERRDTSNILYFRKFEFDTTQTTSF